MTINQQIDFECSTDRLFELFTKQEHFSEITGMPAKIESGPDGSFSLFEGMIEGRNLIWEPGQKLEQLWRVAIWDEGLYSKVLFDFRKLSANHTRLEFEQTDYPEDQKDHLSQGWHDRYWNPVKHYLK